MAKFYVLTTEVRHNTYVIEADSKEQAEDYFYSGDYEPDESNFQSEEIHMTYSDSEAMKIG